MNRTVRVVGVLAASCAAFLVARGGSLEPPGAPAPTMLTLDQLAAKHPFVGFTTAFATQDNLTGGFPGMSDVCAAQFAGSRMCTSAEFMTSTPHPAPSIPGTTFTDRCAWLHPDIRGDSDVSGRLGSWSALSCNGWSTGLPTGCSGLCWRFFSISGTLYWQFATCGAPTFTCHVACCKE